MGGGNVTEGPRLSALVADAVAAGVPLFDAQLMVARAAGLTRAALIARDDAMLPAAALPGLREALARRAAGEPLAYIEGRREFWSMDLEVGPAVLVPRPETELLVETLLELLPGGARRVADLGTGSGAIALAIAHERPGWEVLATDVSPAALAIAQRNAGRLGLGHVRFSSGHWFEALEGEARFDAIVSNPPYVAPEDPALAALAHEPRGALVAEDQGFADLLALGRDAPAFLLPGGWLLLEHGATQAARLASALVSRGYTRVRCLPDLAGRDRVTCAQWP